jgi:hypothetical protein
MQLTREQKAELEVLNKTSQLQRIEMIKEMININLDTRGKLEEDLLAKVNELKKEVDDHEASVKSMLEVMAQELTADVAALGKNITAKMTSACNT